MKTLRIYFLSIIIAFLSFGSMKAQSVSTVDSLNKKYLNWQNLDWKTDKVAGVSVEKAYNTILKGKTPKKKIIVAVIDGGVDTAHVDLKGKIWKNTKEIPGNGIDDDNNGYVDDVYGWNFIGNAKGENVNAENFEYTRVMKKYDPLYKNIHSKDVLTPSQLVEYEMYIKAKNKYNEELKLYQDQKKKLTRYQNKLDSAETTLKAYLKKDTIKQADVEKITSTDENISKAKESFLSLSKKGISRASLKAYKESVDLYLDKYLNLDFNPRAVIGDDPENIKDVKYGNNNVKGPSAGHGTLCSGLIAANRNNGIGINGIAEDVAIMALRVVPDGDERDKDVALAIRYAVDNGANIINMSFGKAFSPQKAFVDDAIKYADAHNVLLVHAAGNDGQNNDSIEHYPTKVLNDGTVAGDFINIGASNYTVDDKYPAFFSNYGQSVDFFAPGMNIISLLPENKYTKANGTSFSCPITTGVAALVWSYYPELTAKELKMVLINSTDSHAKLKVLRPSKTGASITTTFSTLCSSGGSLDAVKALKTAEKMVKNKKK